jgi:hypothetical protein
MEDVEIKNKALYLLRQEEKTYNCDEFSPVDRATLSQFEKQHSICLDGNFKEWLFVSNGSHAGRGGFYGIGYTNDSIALGYKVNPHWFLSRWVPVAGDGFGNTYLVDCSDLPTRGFIFFIDSFTDTSKVTYYVASDFWRFMYMMLLCESDNSDENNDEDLWPFNETFVLSVDPRIALAPSALLPWNVD